MDLYPISTVSQNLAPMQSEHNSNSGRGRPSPNDDGDEEAKTLLDNDNNMKAVKAVLQNGTRRIGPINGLNQCPNGEKQFTADGPKLQFLDEKSSDSPPSDRYNIVYIILVIHGIGILMPWNMFITADNYFINYKLTIIHPNGTQEASIYKEYFLSYLGFASQIPNVLFNLLNIFFHFSSGNFTFRIIGGIVVEIGIIIGTIALAIVNTGEWISGFFYMTMISVVFLNIANGIYQNSLYGLASKMPMRYSNAVVLGSNISGTFTSVVNIVTIWLSPNIRIAAVYYFVSALFVLLVCFDTYLALPINRFYRYHALNEKNAEIDCCPESLTNKLTENGSVTKPAVKSTDGRPPYMFVLRYAWKQCLNVFLVFFVTLSIFPVIHAGIRPIDNKFMGSEDSTKSYFTAVCCFLAFNTCAMIGNIFPGYVQLPGPKRLWIPVVARFIFIPFFLFCNFSPENRVWPVYIQSDALFVLAGVLLGLSSGYLSSLCMMYAPKSVPAEYAGTAGMMAAASLVLGIFFGINFSFCLAWLVKRPIF